MTKIQMCGCKWFVFAVGLSATYVTAIIVITFTPMMWAMGSEADSTLYQREFLLKGLAILNGPLAGLGLYRMWRVDILNMLRESCEDHDERASHG